MKHSHWFPMSSGSTRDSRKFYWWVQDYLRQRQQRQDTIDYMYVHCYTGNVNEWLGLLHHCHTILILKSHFFNRFGAHPAPLFVWATYDRDILSFPPSPSPSKYPLFPFNSVPTEHLRPKTSSPYYLPALGTLFRVFYHTLYLWL